jgi:hypothetical protein
MADVDFQKTFGMSREEWSKKKPKDPIDETIEAIKEKKELPEDVQKTLEEINGFIPINFDYDKEN